MKNVLVERRQDVSVVRLHEVLLVCRDDVLRGRNENVPSDDVSTTSQIRQK